MSRMLVRACEYCHDKHNKLKPLSCLNVATGKQHLCHACEPQNGDCDHNLLELEKDNRIIFSGNCPTCRETLQVYKRA